MFGAVAGNCSGDGRGVFGEVGDDAGEVGFRENELVSAPSMTGCIRRRYKRGAGMKACAPIANGLTVQTRAEIGTSGSSF